MENIDEIIKLFKSKKLSYKDYLRLAQVKDTLTTHLAYEKFKGNSKLTADDIKNFKENLKKDRAEVNYGVSANESKNTEDDEETAQVKKYCSSNVSDPSCVCVNRAIILANKDKQLQAAYDKKYAEWKKESQENEKSYNKKMISYNAQLKEYIDYLNNWKKVDLVYWNKDKPTYDETNDYIQREWHDGTGAYYRDQWTTKHKTEYIQTLTDQWKQEHMITKTVIKQPDVPSVSSSDQCCNNSISGSTNVKDVIQSCNQEIINNTDTGKNKSGEKNPAGKNKSNNDDKKPVGNTSTDNTSTDNTSSPWPLIIGIIVCIVIVISVGFFMSSTSTRTRTRTRTRTSK